jgi:hypothetical protein
VLIPLPIVDVGQATLDYTPSQSEVAELLSTFQGGVQRFWEAVRDNGYVYSSSNTSERILRLNPKTGEVVEFPMRAHYGSEVSNLRISHELVPFLAGHVRNTIRRVLYRYFFRDVSLASIQLVAGAALFCFGLIFGLYHWWAAPHDQLVPTGTIMIAALTFLIGFQLLLSFLNYDISASPREALHPFLGKRPAKAANAEATPTASDEKTDARRSA